MNDYYITFGQNHTHNVKGVLFDKDVVGVISAANYDEAREMAHKVFGMVWCFLYLASDTDVEFLQHFPKGFRPVLTKRVNKTTEQTFKDSDEGKNLIESESADEMFDKLGLNDES